MNELLSEIPYQELQTAYKKLYSSNKELTDNLYYAAFVQQGIMPGERHFKRLENDYFVFYKPLHIIGGDLYWAARKGNWHIYAVGDCTGHGISGAMLTVLATSFLNYLVFSKRWRHLGELFDELDRKWVETFSIDQHTNGNNDWLEISMVAYNSISGELQFCGANNYCLIADKTSFQKINGNPYPIGGWQLETNRSYKYFKTKLETNTTILLSTDGYTDQFGGPNDKRFSKRRWIEMISSIHHLKANETKLLVEQNFNQWKGHKEQTDDVCVMGIKIDNITH